MPTNWFGAAGPLLGAIGTSEGFINLSADGRFVLVTGYAGLLNLPTATALPGTSALSVPRVIALVDGTGAIDTTTLMTNSMSNSETIRSAVSTDGTNLWFSGDTSGIRHTTRGSYLATQLSTTNTNIRVLNISSNQLYFSTASGSAFRLGIAGTEPPPTTNGTTYTALPGLPTTGGSPYAVALFNLTGGPDKFDTLYYTDDTTGAIALYKYSLVSGTWVSNGFISAAVPLRGLTGRKISSSTVQLFVTRSPAPVTGTAYTGAGTFLLGYTDSAGWNAPPTGNGGNIENLFDFAAPAPANTTFRGVAFAPTGSGDPFPSGPGRISVGPLAGLASSVLSGCVSTATREYSISNPGTNAVDWAAFTDVSWLDLSSTNGTLAPATAASVLVSFNTNAAALGAGTNTATVTFTNLTSELGSTTRTITLVVGADSQTFTPATGLNSTGQPGGPFSPLSQTYTLTTAGSSLTWSASKSQSWVDLSTAGGVLDACSNTTVVVSINTNVASTLPQGFYTDTVSISNVTAGTLIATRAVTLNISPNQYFCDDFSTFSPGNLVGQAGWSQQGTISTLPIQVSAGKAWIPGDQTGNNQDAFKNFQQSDNIVVFAGFTVTVTSAPPSTATSPSFFVGLYNFTNATGFANYRVSARAADAANTNFVFAARTTGQTAAPYAFGTQPLNYGTEYRVIVQTDPAGSNTVLYVEPTSAVLEEQTPYLIATSTTGVGPATNVGAVVISQFQSATVPICGVGIGKVCVSTNYAVVYNGITPAPPSLPPFETWQFQYFGSTNCALCGGTADFDGDGMINTNEFVAGFNPTNSTAALRIIQIETIGNDVKVTYLGANGDSTSPLAIACRTNVLEFAPGAAGGSYSNNFTSTGQTNILCGGTGLGIVTNMIHSGGATNIPAGYYRVRVLVP
jgi:hypothetical protein